MESWEEQINYPEKEDDIGYAYILASQKKPIYCTQEELHNEILNNRNVIFVTTPEHDRYIIPGEDYETFKIILKRVKHNIKNSIKESLFYTIGFGLFFFVTSGDEGETIGNKIFLLVFGIIPLINALYDSFSLRKINESNFQKEAYEMKFYFWLDQERVQSIFIFCGILIFIATFQYLVGFGNSIEAAGLVKQLTREGEYWRLLTCTLLHGGWLHIAFNVMALYSIGKMVIRITGVYHFAIAFLFSALLGSISSLLLLPEGTSVGASGGILGLFGFMLVISVKMKDAIPRNIIKSMLNTIIMVAIIGVVAMDVIDNAGHAGGLIGGIITGLLLIRKQNNSIPYTETPLIKTLGIVSMAVLIGGILMILAQLIL